MCWSDLISRGLMLGLACAVACLASAGHAAEIGTSAIVVNVVPADPSSLSVGAVSESELHLSWTDNSSNEEGFSVERKTGSGGTYAQVATTSANVATYNNQGLAAATTYFYRVRAFNGSGYSGYSNEASGTTGSSSGSGGSGGGGGGGGAPPVFSTQAVFKGKAYPKSSVTLLKDAQVVAVTEAGSDANFEINVSGISAGTYVFGVWAQDKEGTRSITHTFSIAITAGATTIVSGIFLPPTISVDKSEVKHGDVISILGQSVPEAKVSVLINSEEEIVEQVAADKGGVWLYKFSTLRIERGNHLARAQASKSGDITTFSNTVSFLVGDRNVAAAKKKALNQADCNGDGRVNLVDFSILAFWYKRDISTAKGAVCDPNGDGKVDIVDFSILAYYWTG